MNQHFKSNERELVKLATFFKKQSKKLIEAGKLGEEHSKVSETVDSFINQMEHHANNRAYILEQRNALLALVKDDAACPKCEKKDMLKLIGTEKNEKDWKSNRYKCRRCNIAFTWNLPNNPWDMMAYMEEMLHTFKSRLTEDISEEERQQLSVGISNAQANFEKIKPVIDAHDQEYNTFMLQETEMEKLVHEFKNALMIEKIKLDSWDNRNLN